MAIRLDCPRCKRPLLVPGKTAGGYAHCPHCQERLWVAKDAPADDSSSEAVPPPAVTAPPPAAQPPGRKVARLVSAETAKSNFQLAADGQLPCLQLQEGEGKAKAEVKSRSVHPLVVLGALGLSLALSVGLVLMDAESSPNRSKKQEEALKVIDAKYFGSAERGLAPYQVYLREAQQARSRGDRKAERQYYRKVLDLLRVEPRDGGASPSQRSDGLEPGLTGSRENDRQLERQISILLGDR
jgi:hypothetical protein